MVLDQSAGEKLICIHSYNRAWLYTGDVNTLVRPIDQEGTCLIKINNGFVRGVDSDCPNQICMNIGSIGNSGEWLACLIHGIIITIRGFSPDIVDARVYR
ncbi:MAG TPA: hypothetical protein DEZ27_02025 [Sphaerochaeta sp.]|nr:hypothetical protein [Sphaerochaeta sp.]